jgi:uncharacterized protein RhaS with RHS repeats
MQQRYYDPLIGRFYSNDPVGFTAINPMMFNRYAYANNNPYKYVDPDGNEAKSFFLENKSYENMGQAVSGAWGDLKQSLSGDLNKQIHDVASEPAKMVGENAGTVGLVASAIPTMPTQVIGVMAGIASDAYNQSVANTTGNAMQSVTGAMATDIASNSGKALVPGPIKAAIHAGSFLTGVAVSAQTEKNEDMANQEEMKE